MATVTDTLGKAVIDILQDYYGNVEKDVRKVVIDVSIEAQKRLRATSPRSGRTQEKEYAKGWKSQIKRDAATYIDTTVYNDTKPKLSHLLEDGRDAGEKNGYSYPAMPPKPHIRKVEEWAAEEVVERLAARL